MAERGTQTVAVLSQQLRDHLDVCEKQGISTNHRLGRIEGILIAVAGALILQLIGLASFLATQAYPSASRNVSVSVSTPQK